jgi:hypothetical protein
LTSYNLPHSMNVFLKIVSLNRKQRPTSVPVQRIVLNSALETTVEAAVESPRATISEKIRVRMTYTTVSC